MRGWNEKRADRDRLGQTLDRPGTGRTATLGPVLRQPGRPLYSSKQNRSDEGSQKASFLVFWFIDVDSGEAGFRCDHILVRKKMPARLDAFCQVSQG